MIQSYILDIIRGQKARPFDLFIKYGLLYPLSFLYGLIHEFRRFAYDHQWFKSFDSGIYTISVGNIVAGGTGKTPYVVALAKQMIPNEKVVILLRGYKGSNEKTGKPLEVTEKSDPHIVGDEAFMIKRQVKEARVIVSKNRLEGAKLAKQFGATRLLLDDGFQHRKIKRNEDIVILDANDPFGKNLFLPAGFLRESKKALRRATKIVINGQDESTVSTIKNWTNAPCFYISYPISGFFDQNDQRIEVALTGKKVALVSAIGNPKRFEDSIKAQGAIVVKSFHLQDHEAPSYERWALFSQEAKTLGASLLLCTEKDRVKIKEPLNLSLTWLWVGITCQVMNNESKS